tara:strand:+ start:835 stop:1263 length:429 start_codon:yes stop_codon:yes gene_type:complete
MNEHDINMDMKPTTIATFENKFSNMINEISTHLEEQMVNYSEIDHLKAMNGISSFMLQFYQKNLKDVLKQLESFMDSFHEMESMRGHYMMKFPDYDKWKEEKVHEGQFFQRKFIFMMREINREIKRLENDSQKSIKEKLQNL